MLRAQSKHNHVFVWVGKDVAKDVRKKALIIGEDFLRANKVRIRC